MRREIWNFEKSPRIGDTGFDLCPISHNACIIHQLIEFFRRISRHLFGIKPVKGRAKMIALFQNGDPRKPGLKSIEHELLKQRPTVIFRHPPFRIVIGHVNRIIPTPRAARDAIHMGMNARLSHAANTAPTGPLQTPHPQA